MALSFCCPELDDVQAPLLSRYHVIS